jgi:hypothetical protein
MSKSQERFTSQKEKIEKLKSAPLGNVVGYDDNDLLLCEDEVDSKVKR